MGCVKTAFDKLHAEVGDPMKPPVPWNSLSQQSQLQVFMSKTTSTDPMLEEAASQICHDSQITLS